MDQTFLIEFGIVLVVAAGLGVILRILRQPLLLAYLIAGVLIGPFALGVIKDSSVIENFASIGIVFLLFLIGLELNPRRLLEVGGSAVAIGLVQIAISGLIYFLVANIFNIGTTGAIYLAAALTFSSTAIIVTLLSNRRDLDSLHGKLIVGVLLVQDFVAIILLSIFSGFSTGILNNLLPYQISFQIVLRALLLFVVTYLVAQYVLPPTFHRIARSQELLFLSSLAWCFLLAMAALALGFSAEIGAFLAGVSLAPLPYSPHIASKTKPLRDFFIMVFFIYLGTNLVFSNIGVVVIPAIIFSALILIVNPVVVMLTTSILGYGKRTSFITGITLTQTSEFSFIVVVLGVKLGILSPEITTLASMVALITVFISTYLIANTNRIYHLISPLLHFLNSGKKDDDMHLSEDALKDHVILIGWHRIGTIVYETLKNEGKKVVVVDVDPKKIQKLVELEENCIFGDAADREIIEHIGLKEAKMVISTINKPEENELILRTYRRINKDIKVIMTAGDIDEAGDLYRLGADLVIIPTMISGDYISHILEQIHSGTTLNKIKESNLRQLEHYNSELFAKEELKDTKKD